MKLQRQKFFARGAWIEEHFVQWITVIMVIINVGLGTAIIAGGSSRFVIPSYSPLIDLVNGHTWIWGVWIMISAILMTFPFRLVNILGLWLGVFWHFMWLSCFTFAVIQYDNAASTPVPTYGGFALIMTALMTAKVLDTTQE